MTTVAANDPLEVKLVETVKNIAAGNAAAELIVERVSRTDLAVWPSMTIKLRWRAKSSVVTGIRNPQDSEYCQSEYSLGQALRTYYDEVVLNPSISEKLANRLRKATSDNFRNLRSGFQAFDIDRRFHSHERCRSCHGNGDVSCTAFTCQSGKIQCNGCQGDGLRQCLSCSGHGTIEVSVRVNGVHSHYDRRTCPQCGGRRRIHSCYTCLGVGRTTCTKCHGSGRVSCSHCDATGWFSNLWHGWLEGDIDRTVVVAKSTSERERRNIKSVLITDIPAIKADVNKESIVSEPGLCKITLECKMPYVEADFRCGHDTFSVDSIGRDGSIASMPTFLDALTFEAIRTIEAETSPERRLKLARKTRLTSSVLLAVCEARKFDPTLIRNMFGMAVSENWVRSIYDSLMTAYNKVGSHVVRWWWLSLGPLFLVFCAAATVYRVNDWLPRRFYGPADLRLYTQWVALYFVLVVPFFLLQLFVGFQARRKVRSALGSFAMRVPSQKQWARAFLVAALAVEGTLIGGHIGLSIIHLPCWSPQYLVPKIALGPQSLFCSRFQK